MKKSILIVLLIVSIFSLSAAKSVEAAGLGSPAPAYTETLISDTPADSAQEQALAYMASPNPDNDPLFELVKYPGSSVSYEFVGRQEDFDQKYNAQIQELKTKVDNRNALNPQPDFTLNNDYTTPVGGYKSFYSYEESPATTVGDLCRSVTLTIRNQTAVELNAAAWSNPNLTNHPNNGYLIKVANPNNHDGVSDSILGPGNLEMQHWVSRKSQYFRPVFATDFGMDNAVWTITLPFDPADSNVRMGTIKDGGNWYVNTYFPRIGKGGFYQLHPIDTSAIQINGNVLTINLGNLPARSAMALEIPLLYDTDIDFSNENANPTNIGYEKVVGNWAAPLADSHKTYRITSSSGCQNPTESSEAEPSETSTTTATTENTSESIKPTTTSTTETLSSSKTNPIVPTTTKAISKPLPATGTSENTLYVGSFVLTIIAGLLLVIKRKHNSRR